MYGGVVEWVGGWSSCRHGDSRLFVRSGGILLHHSNCGGGVRVRSCVRSPPSIYIYIYIHVFLFIYIYISIGRHIPGRIYIYIYIHVFSIYIYLYFQ